MGRSDFWSRRILFVQFVIFCSLQGSIFSSSLWAFGEPLLWYSALYGRPSIIDRLKTKTRNIIWTLQGTAINTSRTLSGRWEIQQGAGSCRITWRDFQHRVQVDLRYSAIQWYFYENPLFDIFNISADGKVLAAACERKSILLFDPLTRWGSTHSITVYKVVIYLSIAVHKISWTKEQSC